MRDFIVAANTCLLSYLLNMLNVLFIFKKVKLLFIEIRIRSKESNQINNPLKPKIMNYQTKEELKSTIVDAINDGRIEGKPVSELHHEVFNTDYFIIGRYQAEQWLIKNGGIFNAIETIKDYEQDNFGEVNTDLSEAEKVCNMYVYILGEEIINELQVIRDNWDNDFTPELIEELREELEN
ncbi:hypothetical protein CCP3SC1AL1_510019 [Gammaproteobacteria bacterium]